VEKKRVRTHEEFCRTEIQKRLKEKSRMAELDAAVADIKASMEAQR
jgi:hypothetical protein